MDWASPQASLTPAAQRLIMSSLVINVTDSAWVDIHSALSIDAGTPVTVFNKSGFTNLFLVTASTQPEVKNGMPLWEHEYQYVNPGDGLSLWAISIQGNAEVYATDEPVTGALPDYVFTGSNQGTSRLRVDVGQTGFFERREFRISEELTIPTGTSLVYRFESPVNFILWEQVIECDANLLKFEAIVGGTEGGSFTPVTIWGKNRMTEQPEYARQVTVSKGGTVTGGQVAEVLRLQAAGATAQRVSVGNAVGSERGLPAGVYYLKLSAIGGDVTGTFALVWEERP